jgi:Zn-dependent M16 (insulinase) family peptidase
MPNGFSLQRSYSIPELASSAALYKHDKTGARFLSVLNEDPNKVFAITFRTPPSDSTGIAHIMEHSVLCGSEKYPLKEPFIELVKGSLQTFLNAFTFPDKTMYPCASQNYQDFKNLIDVYMDAVLHPRIPEHILDQEGWHLEYQKDKHELIYKGVVFNEMKGVYSDADRVVSEELNRYLYPDHIYSLSSGGDPRIIPKLTYSQFKEFHENYYHPSNSFIVLYGDFPEEERLGLMEGYLAGFERNSIDSRIPIQAPFREIQKAEGFFPPSNEEDKDGRDIQAWAMPLIEDPQTAYGLGILEHILLGTPASPLRKALEESKLGKDVIGSLEMDLVQPLFTTGLKGVNESNAGKVFPLIEKTLKALVEDGIPVSAIEASMNTIEFRLRENNTAGYPPGLLLIIRAMQNWLYDCDPVDAIAFEKPISQIKNLLSKGDRYFESLIENYLLNNQHSVQIQLKPDTKYSAKRDAEEKSELAEKLKAMSAAELENIESYQKELHAIQEAPESPEALSSLPSLDRKDLDRNEPIIPGELEEHFFFHDIFTNGLIYSDFVFDIAHLDSKYWPFLSLYAKALTSVATESKTYTELIETIGKKTGGISATLLIDSFADRSKGTGMWFVIKSKTTREKIEDIRELVEEILFQINFDSKDRIKQMIQEDVARKESQLVSGGHMVVGNQLSSELSESGWIKNQISGLPSLNFMKSILENFDSQWDEIVQMLKELHKQVLGPVLINLTASQADKNAAIEALSPLISKLPSDKKPERSLGAFTAQRRSKGILLPSQINFVGLAADLYEKDEEISAAILPVNRFLGTSYLWERIRVQGGAYGGFSNFNRYTGLFMFLSYRDPNIAQSYSVYKAVPQYLKELELVDEEMKKLIIGSIGQIDSPLLAQQKGYEGLRRHLLGIEQENLQKWREQVLGCSMKDVKEIAERLEQAFQNPVHITLGFEDKMDEFDPGKKILPRLKISEID